MRRLMVTVLVVGLLSAAPARAADGPSYDVPRGFTRCPHALAWHGFFKWASAKDASCRETQRFMREYGEKAGRQRMPTSVAGYRCKIFYWRNDDGDVYASRHTCTRHGVRAFRAWQFALTRMPRMTFVLLRAVPWLPAL